MKTENNHGEGGLLTFGNLTQQLQIDTYEIQNTSQQNVPRSTLRSKLSTDLDFRTFGHLELNILTYYGTKDDIYDTLTLMSRKSLYFMKMNHNKIEKMTKLQHANEKLRLIPVKSIEEHSSGVNQLLRISQKELVTVSDDCYLKFWSAQNLKVESSIPTETITCICQTGQKRELLIAGCHSGNLLIMSISSKAKKDQIMAAHYNLIRVIVSLDALKNRFFVTADVCGVLKVWPAQTKATECLKIDLEQAVSYNSMVEVTDVLPDHYEETAMIAVALKSQKVMLICLLPQSGSYQIIKTLKTQSKPTCLIQLTTRHLAIATGSLKEPSQIELHDLSSGRLLSTLRYHKDMIDSLLKLSIPQKRAKSSNRYVNWLLSASRDRQLVIWKLLDGKVLSRSQLGYEQLQRNITGGIQQIKTSKESQSSLQKRKKEKKQQRRASVQEDVDEEEDEEEESEEEEEKEEEEDQKEEENKELQDDDQVVVTQKQTSVRMQDKPRQQEFFFALDSGHKDFIRSMVQLNDTTILTASEDKTLKIFNLAY